MDLPEVSPGVYERTFRAHPDRRTEVPRVRARITVADQGSNYRFADFRLSGPDDEPFDRNGTGTWADD